MIKEEAIQQKMSELASSYGNLTGKGSTWKDGLTISEYAELRKMAISEIQMGISSGEVEIRKEIAIPEKRPIREPVKEVPKDSKEKEEPVVFNYHEKKNDEIKESVMDKFNKVKDM